MVKQKQFKVSVDMIWSQEYIVKAATISEAKKKAWEKFQSKLPKKDFSIDADRVD